MPLMETHFTRVPLTELDRLESPLESVLYAHLEEERLLPESILVDRIELYLRSHPREAGIHNRDVIRRGLVRLAERGLAIEVHGLKLKKFLRQLLNDQTGYSTAPRGGNRR